MTQGLEYKYPNTLTSPLEAHLHVFLSPSRAPWGTELQAPAMEAGLVDYSSQPHSPAPYSASQDHLPNKLATPECSFQGLLLWEP